MSLWVWMAMAFVLGACVGSFLNVVILRMPAGMSVVHPPSHDPSTGKPLAWWENLPLLSYVVILRGRSRSSGGWISPQYPVVELVTGVLFAWVVWVVYGSGLRPDFALATGGVTVAGWPWASTWPVLLVWFTLVGCLVAATVIDARLFVIPIEITWVAAGMAVVVLPVAAGFGLPTGWVVLTQTNAGWGQAPRQWLVYAMPRAGDAAMWVAIGGAVGLAVANGLLCLRVLPRGFDELSAGYAEAVAKAEAEAKEAAGETEEAESEEEGASDVGAVWSAVAIASVVCGLLAGGLLVVAGLLPMGWRAGVLDAIVGWPMVGGGALVVGLVAVGVVLACFVALILVGVMGDKAEASEVEAELGLFGRPRWEVGKELMFVAWPVAGMAVGAGVAWWMGLVEVTAGRPLVVGGVEAVAAFGAVGSGAWPAWAEVLGGVVLGYLVGGGVVWLTRIVATLAFGREAMGLGDVHLMAAAGAVVGGADASIAFFLAALLGLGAAVVMIGLARMARGGVRVMPYGPYLAAAVVVLMAVRVPVQRFLGIF